VFQFIRKNPLFSQLASINLFSKTGDRLFYTAMLTVASTLPEANLAVMIVSASETLPILFSFLLGSLADQKANKLKSLIKTSFFRMILYFFIAWIVSYSATLLLVLSMALLNFISDVSGNYSSALVTPFTKMIVHAEDMEKAQGIISITTQLINVIATFAGSILLSLFFIETVAYANAGIFFMVAISYIFISAKLKTTEKNIPINKQQKLVPIIKNNFKSLFQHKEILNDLCQLSLLNGLFGGLTPIFVMFIQTEEVGTFFTSPFLISLLSGAITISMIIGNSISSNFLKNVTTTILNRIANLLIVLIGIGFLLKQLTFILISASFIALLLGIVSPKFTAKVINYYPTERLGGVITTVNSCLTLTPPLTSLLFPMFANISLSFAYFCFIIYSLLLLGLNFLTLRSYSMGK